MHTHVGFWFASLLLVALSVASCAHDDGQSAVTTTTAAVRDNGDAIGTLAHARCERASQCNHIGNGAFGTPAECRDAMRHEMDSELGSDSCPRGIDKAQLDRCVAVTRDMTCHNPFAPLSAFSECKPATLCARQEAR